jgi:alpha-beta hydrolase superfamily lysophospholipase
MIPVFAEGLHRAGFVAHAFNFSHSGMSRNVATFERTDLFARDTWNKQVFDLQCVVQAIAGGELMGTGLPYVLVGHSRGGVTAILFAGRTATESRVPKPAGIVTAGTPDTSCGLSAAETTRLRQLGYLESPSARTGQILRVGVEWLTEQESHPRAHDVLGNVGKIECPILVLHGEHDETVNVASAWAIARAAQRAQVVVINDGDHVFLAPNPPPADIRAIPQLCAAVDAIIAFALQCTRPPHWSMIF